MYCTIKNSFLFGDDVSTANTNKSVPGNEQQAFGFKLNFIKRTFLNIPRLFSSFQNAKEIVCLKQIHQTLIYIRYTYKTPL